jgi:hypothetical protein
MTRLIVAFRDFANAPKKWILGSHNFFLSRFSHMFPDSNYVYVTTRVKKMQSGIAINIPLHDIKVAD